MIALVVALTIHRGLRARFLDAVDAQAEASLTEPGCLHFDVCADVADPDAFVLYEIYRDHDALEAHRRTAHFPRWRAAADELVAEQRNTITEIVVGTGAGTLPR
jgi:quinol monooxygenase YgiN